MDCSTFSHIVEVIGNNQSNLYFNTFANLKNGTLSEVEGVCKPLKSYASTALSGKYSLNPLWE